MRGNVVLAIVQTKIKSSFHLNLDSTLPVSYKFIFKVNSKFNLNNSIIVFWIIIFNRPISALLDILCHQDM